jgi:hypothetical protein
MFEICAHPDHSTERATSSMIYLDHVIQSLALTSVDHSDLRVSRFAPRSVPSVYPGHPGQYHRNYSRGQPSQPPPFRHDFGHPPYEHIGYDIPPPGCSCKDWTLGSCSPSTLSKTPLWVSTPAWNSTSEVEIRKESCRRLCWSTMNLATGHVFYSSASKTRSLDLFVANPANVSGFSSVQILLHQCIGGNFVPIFSSMPSFSPENLSHTTLTRIRPCPRRTRYGDCMIVRSYYGTAACRCFGTKQLATSRSQTLVSMLCWRLVRSRRH